MKKENNLGEIAVLYIMLVTPLTALGLPFMARASVFFNTIMAQSNWCVHSILDNLTESILDTDSIIRVE